MGTARQLAGVLAADMDWLHHVCAQRVTEPPNPRALDIVHKTVE
jgi:hypothetical protein